MTYKKRKQANDAKLSAGFIKYCKKDIQMTESYISLMKRLELKKENALLRSIIISLNLSVSKGNGVAAHFAMSCNADCNVMMKLFEAGISVNGGKEWLLEQSIADAGFEPSLCIKLEKGFKRSDVTINDIVTLTKQQLTRKCKLHAEEADCIEYRLSRLNCGLEKANDK